MSSLRDALDAGDWVESCILQFRTPQYHDKKFFVLEGKSDIGFYRNLFRAGDVYFDSPCGGKVDVIDSVRRLKEQGVNYVLGVCDADFDHLLQTNYDNILVTDIHDIEMMMISSEFICKFFHDYTKHDSYSFDSTPEICEGIMNGVLEACYCIGVLKFINIKYGIGLNFKGMKYDNFLDVNGFTVHFDRDAYLQHILSRSREHVDYNFETLGMMYVDYYSHNYDKAHVCNGHDFSYILSMLYKGEHSQKKNINQDDVERALRFYYSARSFTLTELGRSLKNLIFGEEAGLSEAEVA